MKTTTHIPSFKSALWASVITSISQFPALVINAALLFALLCLELLAPVALFWLGSREGYVIAQGISLVWFIYLFFAYNGALGYLFGSIPTNPSFTQAWESRKKGLRFQINSLRVGVLLLFGQLFLVCLCFLFLSNYITSPYLYIYEGLSGKKAEERSVELARGFSWDVLSRTLLLLISGYAALILIVLIGFTTASVLLYTIAPLAFLFIGLVQSNIIYSLYNDLKSIPGEERGKERTVPYRLAVIALLLLVVVIYVTIKMLPLI